MLSKDLLNIKGRILLLVCCAPCCAGAVEFIAKNNLDITLFFYNPNIYPEKEYNHRKNEVLREAMKTYSEDAKNQLSFKESEDIISNLGDLGEDEDGEEIELDLTLTQAQVFEVMRPYFQ